MVREELDRASCFFAVSKPQDLLSHEDDQLCWASISLYSHQESLTDFPASHHGSLLGIQRFLAGRNVKELNKTIRLFNGHLSQFSVFVKDVEQIPLGNSFGGKVAWKEGHKS